MLIVDDCVDTADSLALLIRWWGHETETCHDGDTALRIAARFSPQVVLIDLGLPSMDGFEVASRLRNLPGSRSALLVAVTGWQGDIVRQRVREAGFAHYFLKPTDPDELRLLLRDVDFPPVKSAAPAPFRSIDRFKPGLWAPLTRRREGVPV